MNKQQALSKIVKSHISNWVIEKLVKDQRVVKDGYMLFDGGLTLMYEHGIEKGGDKGDSIPCWNAQSHKIAVRELLADIKFRLNH